MADDDMTLDETVDETLPEPKAEPAVQAPPPPAADEPAPAAVESAPAADEPAPAAAEPAPAAVPRRPTVARLASAAELKAMRRIYGDVRTKRRVLWGVVATVALAGILFGVHWKLSQTEGEYTWPGSYDGNFDDGQLDILYAGRVAFQVYFPNDPTAVIGQDESQTWAEVATRIGRYREGALHLRFDTNVLTNGFEQTLESSYRAYLNARQGENWQFFPQDEVLAFFNPHVAGWPYYEIVYNRPDEEGRTWWGFLIYLRDLDREFVLRREVPAIDWSKSSAILRDTSCLYVSRSLTEEHFEIPERLRPGNPTVLLRNARNEMSRNFQSAVWEDIEATIKTVLTIAYRDDDKTLMADAKLLKSRFRTAQQVWYNRMCFEYLTAASEGNEAEMLRIRRLARQKFSFWDDARRRKIERDIWRVE